MDLPLSHLGFSLGLSIVSGLLSKSENCPKNLSGRLEQMAESWFADTADWSENLGDMAENIAQDISLTQEAPPVQEILEWNSIIDASITLMEEHSTWLRDNELHRKAFLDGIAQSVLAMHEAFGNEVTSLIPVNILEGKVSSPLALTDEQSLFVRLFKVLLKYQD